MGRVSSAPFAGASTDANPSLRLLDEMLSWTRPRLYLITKTFVDIGNEFV